MILACGSLSKEHASGRLSAGIPWLSSTSPGVMKGAQKIFKPQAPIDPGKKAKLEAQVLDNFGQEHVTYGFPKKDYNLRD